MSRVVIVGAGLGGLSAACHLAGGRHGAHDVVVVERASVPGGRAGLLAERGYRIDSGPSVLTMVDLLESTFAAAGRRWRDLLTLAPVDPMYRACFEDGSTMYVRHGREAMAEEIRSVAGAGRGASFHRFARLARPSCTGSRCRTSSTATSTRRCRWRHGRSPWRASPARRLRPRRHHVARVLPRRAPPADVLASRRSTPACRPCEALGRHAVITYMDSIAGVFFPKGGIHAVATGLAAAAEKAGAQFRYDAEVDRVLRSSDGSVRGVRHSDGEVVAADVVVVNADLPVAYQRLLPDLPMPRAARNGPVLAVVRAWLVGAAGPPPEGAAHHNIHFGKQWAGAFDALLTTKTRASPTRRILISVHTVGDPTSRRPDRMRCISSNRRRTSTGRPFTGTYARRGSREPARTLRRARVSGPAEQVDVERLIDPVDWERMGMATGTPFALSHTLPPDRSVPAWQRRPARARARVRRIVDRARRRRSDGPRERSPGSDPGRGVRSMTTWPRPALRSRSTRATRPAVLLNKRHGTTYYWSTKLLPAVKRPHVHALYALLPLRRRHRRRPRLHRDERGTGRHAALVRRGVLRPALTRQAAAITRC